MCGGGWPQNAYEYVMKHDGLPQKSKDYDADFLLTLTSVINNESEEVSEYDMSNYFAQICPAGSREGEGDSLSGSGDAKNSGADSGTRYGKIKGYGYATDRCICYSDGTGCDCDQQNEKTAVLNIASYGPAAVCLEASEWADYSGGIITSDSVGCSAGFQDMNHCVEVSLTYTHQRYCFVTSFPKLNYTQPHHFVLCSRWWDMHSQMPRATKTRMQIHIVAVVTIVEKAESERDIGL